MLLQSKKPGKSRGFYPVLRALVCVLAQEFLCIQTWRGIILPLRDLSPAQLGEERLQMFGRLPKLQKFQADHLGACPSVNFLRLSINCAASAYSEFASVVLEFQDYFHGSVNGI